MNTPNWIKLKDGSVIRPAAIEAVRRADELGENARLIIDYRVADWHNSIVLRYPDIESRDTAADLIEQQI